MLPLLLQIKAWCYYESRLLGAHHGLISTYALETLVLYVFNKYHSSRDSPLAVSTAQPAERTRAAARATQTCLYRQLLFLCQSYLIAAACRIVHRTSGRASGAD
jgi:hypothetical protein